MKVLLVNGSPHAQGNTALALQEMEKVFRQEGIETEIMHIGHLNIRGCISCGGCRRPSDPRSVRGSEGRPHQRPVHPEPGPLRNRPELP